VDAAFYGCFALNHVHSAKACFSQKISVPITVLQVAASLLEIFASAN